MKTHILIVEDDQTLGEILLRKLEKEGYDATLCSDGAKGFEAITNIKPALILLDILLPTMNGYEILEAKNKNPDIKDIPVIIISNSGQPVELKRTLELGARDYFIKAQLDPDDIISKVKSLAPVHGYDSVLTLEGKKILLVEDDPFLSDVLNKKLTNEKCEVFRASTGEEAIEIALKEQPSAILLDLVLPGLTGFQTLEKLKSDPATHDIHVIVLSNLSQSDDVERVKALGADLFLVKAVSTPTIIYDTIRSLLAKS